MSENRVRRVAEQIKKDISQIISSELKDPRIAGITSVTEVQLSRDLRYASAYVSVYGTEEEKEEMLQILTKASGFIRSEIGKRIRLRYTPVVNFYLDNSIEYGAHIDSVIKSLKMDEKTDDEGSKKDN
ncbi:MAG: 30S ribosome-binding factor RbfA [Bacillota bacterium]|jgi:ribosome-binding factor A|nr:30S ribosome-binding factor RbfA [Bacillota bacterium]